MTSINQLDEFPIPTINKSCWPWVHESPRLPSITPNGSQRPKLSIVTPSFNQSQYLEETIRSVLLQGYPNIEYIIIDGGSSDGSVEIIKKYEPWLKYWVSEPDQGQSNAINKGFAHSTGEIMGWINSDDYYAAGVFKNIINAFICNKTDWITGNSYILRFNGAVTSLTGQPSIKMDQWLMSNPLCQPAVFWRKSLWTAVFGVDEGMHYSFDYDLWLKFTNIQPYPFWIDEFIAYFRIHKDSKSFTDILAFEQENKILFQRYRNRLSLKDQYHVWKFRQEEISKRHLSSNNYSESSIAKIFYGFLNAPWIIFKRYFYGKVKKILLVSKYIHKK